MLQFVQQAHSIKLMDLTMAHVLVGGLLVLLYMVIKRLTK